MDRARIPPSKTDIDEREFRLALGRFATGIAVVTARNAEGAPFAMTVNAMTSVSLDPPLVLFCLGKSAFTFDRFAGADAFAINVLNSDQRALSDRFARGIEDHFPDLAVGRLTTGSPILADCLAALDCTTETRHEAGDHLVIIGRVRAIDVHPDVTLKPLVYFGSGYRELKPCDDA